MINVIIHTNTEIEAVKISEMAEGCYLLYLNDLSELDIEDAIVIGAWDFNGNSVYNDYDYEIYKTYLLDENNEQVNNFAGWNNRNL